MGDRNSSRFFTAVICILALGLPTLARASGAPAFKGIGKVLGVSGHRVRVRNYDLDFRLYQYVNELGEKEVSVELRDERALFAKPNVLIGRDLDGDGRFDTWFIPLDEEGFRVIESVAMAPDGWDVASVLVEKLGREGKLSVIMSSIGLGLKQVASFTVAWVQYVIDDSFSQFARTELLLLDWEVRLKHIEKRDRMSPIVIEGNRYLADAWSGLADEIQNFQDVKLPAYAVANVVLVAGLAQLATKLKPVVSKVWQRVAITRPVSYATEFLYRAVAGLGACAAAGTERAEGSLARWGIRFTRHAGARVVLQGVWMTYREHAQASIAALAARGRLGKVAAATLLKLGEVGLNGIKRLPYTAWTQGLQVMSEAVVRWPEVKGSNPKVVVQNLMKQPGFERDFLYMTNETFLMAAVTNGRGTLLRRMGVCAGIAFVDSTAVTFFTHKGGATSYMIDTGWEATLGVGQTALDLTILKNVEARAQSQVGWRGKVGWHLAGYLLTGIDQAIGYLGYGYLSRFFEKRDHATPAGTPTLPLFPDEGIPEDGDENLAPELVPVFAPA